MSRYLYTFTPIFTDRCGTTDAIDWETQGSWLPSIQLDGQVTALCSRKKVGEMCLILTLLVLKLLVLKVAFKKHVSICSCNKKSSVFSSWCTVSIFWVVKYSGDFLFRARFYSWYFLQIMLLHNAMCLLSTVLIFWVSKIVLNLCSAFMDVCIFGVIFWKSWCCIRQCVCFIQHHAS